MTLDALTDPWATTTTPPTPDDPAAPFLTMPRQRGPLRIGPQTVSDLEDRRTGGPTAGRTTSGWRSSSTSGTSDSDPDRMDSMSNEQADDLVWIRGAAEVNIAGVDPIDVYESISRSEWDSMTAEQRDAYLDDVGGAALEQIASYGADVVDESEVPAAEKQR